MSTTSTFPIRLTVRPISRMTPVWRLSALGNSITDPDNTTMQSATITLTNHQADDVLAVNGALPGGIIASSYNAATGVLTLTGSAPLAAYDTALHQVVFSNSSDNPSSLDRTVTMTVNDGFADSNSVTTTVHVVPSDDAPVAADDNVITNVGTGTSFQIPNSALLANDSDPDNSLSQLTITGVTNASGGNASANSTAVTFTDTGSSGGSFNYTLSDGSLTGSGHVTVSQDTSGALDGSDGADILIGKSGGSTINGNGGADILIGNTGADTMNGGGGNDTFVFRALADSQPGAGHFDTIADFTHNSDHIDLSAIAGATNVQGAVNSANVVDAHSISWFVDNNQTVLYVNTTATANHVDMEIHLTGTNISLSGSDILHHT